MNSLNNLLRPEVNKLVKVVLIGGRYVFGILQDFHDKDYFIALINDRTLLRQVINISEISAVIREGKPELEDDSFIDLNKRGINGSN